VDRLKYLQGAHAETLSLWNWGRNHFAVILLATGAAGK